jgi:hypothetical protein
MTTGAEPTVAAGVTGESLHGRRRLGRTPVWAALSVVVTLVSVVLVLSWMRPAEMIALLARGHHVGLALGFLFCALANALKSERLRRLTPEAAGTGRIAHFSMVCVYNLASSLMPAGLGEASYPAMLRMRHGGNMAAGLSAVVVTRLMDLWAVPAFAVAALWAAAAHRAPHRGWLTAVLALGAVAAVVCLPYVKRSNLARRAWGRATGGADDGAAVQPLRVASAAWQSRVPLTLLTIAFWTSGYMSAWAAAWALGLPLGFAEVVEGNSLALLVSALPIKGALGFGTHHVGWVAGLAIFGWSGHDALAAAIPIHLVGAVYTIALGAAGWALGLMRHLGPAAARQV